MTWGVIASRDKGFSSLQNVWTGSRAHPASYSLGTRGAFPRSKVFRTSD